MKEKLARRFRFSAKNLILNRAVWRKGKILFAGVVVLAGVALGATDYWGNEIREYTEGGQTKTYQFVLSGVPVENESYSQASDATSFETGTLSELSPPSAIEARYLTWDESEGIPLDSTKMGVVLVVR